MNIIKLTITLTAIILLYSLPIICSGDAKTGTDVDIRAGNSASTQFNNFLAPTELFDRLKAVSDLELSIKSKKCDIFKAKQSLDFLKSNSHNINDDLSKQLDGIEIAFKNLSFELLKNGAISLEKDFGQIVIISIEHNKNEFKKIKKQIKYLRNISNLSDNILYPERDEILKKLEEYETSLKYYDAAAKDLSNNQQINCNCKCFLM